MQLPQENKQFLCTGENPILHSYIAAEISLHVVLSVYEHS
jgi:hypothetical protein